jgi:phage-related protein (TIGR01555 family)
MSQNEKNIQSAKIVADKPQSPLNDSLENLVAQLGTEQDKRHNSRFVNSKRLSATGNEQELNALYRTDWLAGKVVDIVPEDMTREWREFTGDIKPETIDLLVEEEERLQLSNSFQIAHQWARLYGTAFIVLSVDDGQLPDKELDLSKVKEGSLRHIKVVDRTRLNHAEQQPIGDPLDANYGFPEYYRFNETSTKIHHSRVIRFDGVLLPFQEFRENNYFSDSVLDRLYDAITNFNTTANGAASMVYETNVDIVKVKGLMGYLQTAEGESTIRKRFALANMLKSFNNTLLLDNEEDFNTKNNTFAGLPDLLDRFAKFLSAATDIPATRLLGTSASGMNATGEGDLKNYYDMIRSKQKSVYKPKLDYFDEIMIRSLGLNPEDDYKYEFSSLFQMTPEQQSTVDMNNSTRDKNYFDIGVLSETQIAKELQQKGTYTNITDEDIKELEELEELDNEFEPNTEDPQFGTLPQVSEGEEKETESDNLPQES